MIHKKVLILEVNHKINNKTVLLTKDLLLTAPEVIHLITIRISVHINKNAPDTTTKETTTAIAHVKEFTIQDLEKELDRIEDLSQLRKELTMKLFLKREMEIYKIYDEYNKDENIKRYQKR